ncbi:transient receptor potential cation channel subfamily A member 1-like [Anticarsia gemmatalis]|uniref:transient receptor potential cation channel subfamily A member 1-like n=1 Tax=Anticarsia gemmatalis TaxID=129554 RepID=UPI003F76819C
MARNLLRLRDLERGQTIDSFELEMGSYETAFNTSFSGGVFLEESPERPFSISSDDYFTITGTRPLFAGSEQRIWKRKDHKMLTLNTQLLQAVDNEDCSGIFKLLEFGASPNATCRLNHVTACHVAAMNNNDSLALLLEAGADAFRTDRYGRTPLHLAAWSGNSRQIAMLLDFPEDLQDKVTLGMSPETEEEVRRYCSGQELLTNVPCIIGCLPELAEGWSDSMEHNCRRIREIRRRVLRWSAEPGWTALHLASARAHTTCVRLLLAAGADPCAQDIHQRTPLDVAGAAYYCEHKMDVDSFRATIEMLVSAGAKTSNLNMFNSPLHTAVQLDSVEAIEELLRTGARATCLDAAGRTPMHVCVEKRLKEHLQILVKRDRSDREDGEPEPVDAVDLGGCNVLHAAVRAKWIDGVCIALSAGASMFTRAKDGESPFHCAAAAGDIHIFKETLTIAKFNIDFQNSKGQTALFVAVINNHIDIAQILIEYGASVAVTLPGKLNILHQAAQHSSVKMLEHLFHFGGPIVDHFINLLSEEGYTPIIYAIIENKADNVQFLIKKGSKIDLFVKFKYQDCEDAVLTTPLHIAAAKNFFQVTMFIVNREKNTIHKPNREGLFPLHDACRYGNKNIITFLVHKGADLSRETDHPKMSVTPMDMLMDYMTRPTEYMQKVFDDYIKISSKVKNLQDSECKVTVTYDILLANADKQMKVIKALVDTGNRHEQRQLLQHPFIESFLCLKWQALIPYFYVIVALYACFVLSLNVYVVSVFYYQDKNNQNNTNVTELAADKPKPDYLCSKFWMYLTYITAALMFIQIVFVKLQNKIYFLFLETWVKLGASVLALMLPTFVSSREHQALNTPGTTANSPDWARLIAATALLMSWLNMMLLLSKFPNWGFYVLMFGKVATKVFKILITFGFLIFGFSLCFMIQFHVQPPFEDPLGAITKIFMMTSEYDYSSLISKQERSFTETVVLRLTFMTFFALVAITLMNLIVGVAVNDVNNLEVLGNQERLQKQVDFLATVEDIICYSIVRFSLTYLRETKWYDSMMVDSQIELRPREATCPYRKILPPRLRMALIEKAMLREKRIRDVKTYMDHNKKFEAIYDAVVEQGRRDNRDEELCGRVDMKLFNETVARMNVHLELLRREIKGVSMFRRRSSSLS